MILHVVDVEGTGDVYCISRHTVEICIVIVQILLVD